MSTVAPTSSPGGGLAGSLRKNQKQLLIGGAVLAAALGYAKYRSNQAAAAASNTSGGYTTQPATGQAAYDSTGNDVYDALQPQIEQTQGMLQKLLDQQASSTPKPPPTRIPTPPTGHHPKPPPRKTPPPHAVHPPKTSTYTVRKGDTLTKIGNRYGVSWMSIFHANRNTIRNPNLIRPGERLVVPAKR